MSDYTEHREDIETREDLVTKLSSWPVSVSEIDTTLDKYLPSKLVGSYGYEYTYSILNDMIGRIGAGQSKSYIKEKFTRVMHKLTEEDFKSFYRTARVIESKVA